MLRLGLALALAILSTTAAHAAAPRLGPILGVHHGGPAAAGAISHVIYLNNCVPNGCDVKAGADDAANHVSSIPTQPRHLSPWQYGDTEWQALVACVTQVYAPFGVEIVTTRPSAGRYTENMVAGLDKELRPDCVENGPSGSMFCAGGLAPFIDCDGGTDNAITFTFANTGSETVDYLCATVAQETAHLFGLDHEMNAADPMTYLDPGTHKVFQDTDSPCGESANRTCYCGTATQNSARYLTNLFSAAPGDSPMPPDDGSGGDAGSGSGSGSDGELAATNTIGGCSAGGGGAGGAILLALMALSARCARGAGRAS